jgi:PAS domain-containing protein
MRAVSFVLGRDWTVRTCTGDALSLLGVACSVLEGNALPPFLRDGLEPVLAQAFLGTVVPSTRAKIELPAGEPRLVSLTAAPAVASDPDGTCDRILVVVDERHRVELVVRDQTTERELIASLESERQALLDREAHLAAIYENAPLILMFVDEERRVQQMNGYGGRFAD